MEREIKFRAWDEQNKVMHYNFEYIRSGNEGNDWIVFVSDKQPLTSKPHPLENPYFSQQLNIMLFTGLKDKNGKEIYEGDILYLDESPGSHHKIYFDEKSCKFTDVRLEDGDSNTDYYGFEFVEDCVVIGNIYENPELLK